MKINRFHQRHSHCKQKQGSTLVEVMIALFVLATVLASVYMAMAQGFMRVESARNLTQASQLLQTEMEYVRTLNWAEIVALGNTSSFNPHFSSGESTLRSLTTTRTISDARTDQKLIILTATWDDSRGQTHSRSYRTLYTKEGISDYYSRTF